MGIKISDEIVLLDIARVARELGRTPLVMEYERFGKYSVASARNKFGSWSKAIRAARLEPNPLTRETFDDEFLRSELDRVTDELGHSPSWSELTQRTIISPDTFDRRVGKSSFTDPRLIIPESDTWSVDSVSESDGSWVAGLIAGEGSFILNASGGVGFRVGLRADDRSMLEDVKSIMALPIPIGEFSNAHRRAKGERAGDEIRLSVAHRWVCRKRVIPFFDRFRLRGRKEMDFRVWREGVLFLCKRDEQGRWRSRFTDEEKAVILDTSSRLQALRFDPSKTILPA